MKVLNLRCINGHGFEGWFGSDDDYAEQSRRGLVECPLCGDDTGVTRMPTAPRLNLSGARAPATPESASGSGGHPAAGASMPPASAAETPPAGASAAVADAPADLPHAWLAAVRRVIANTEDVGPRFAEEARRIHYGETPHRGIRGQATPEERLSLEEEGIETMALPLPRGLLGPAQ